MTQLRPNIFYLLTQEFKTVLNSGLWLVEDENLVLSHEIFGLKNLMT